MSATPWLQTPHPDGYPKHPTQEREQRDRIAGAPNPAALTPRGTRVLAAADRVPPARRLTGPLVGLVIVAALAVSVALDPAPALDGRGLVAVVVAVALVPAGARARRAAR
jgi:hypothetical protein